MLGVPPTTFKSHLHVYLSPEITEKQPQFIELMYGIQEASDRISEISEANIEAVKIKISLKIKLFEKPVDGFKEENTHCNTN